MIRAVIFDMDGTMIDTEKYHNQFWCQAAKEAGFELEREQFFPIRSLAPADAAAYMHTAIGEDFDYYAIRSRKKELMQMHLEAHGLEKKPGLDELLDYLNSHYYKTAVATATEESMAYRYLDEIGVLGKLDEVVCAPSLPHGKPMPDVYLHACSQIHEKPEDCIALEDSPNGILSAYRAGCHPVMIPDLTEPDAQTAALLHARVDTLRDVIGLL